MKKKTVYVPVSVDERLPDKTHANVDGEIIVDALDNGHFEETFFDPKDNSFWIPFVGERCFPTHWLEKQEKYILSEDELKEFTNDNVNRLIQMLPVGHVDALDLIRTINNWNQTTDEFLTQKLNQ